MDALGATTLVVIDVQNDFVHEDGAGASLGYAIADSQKRMPDIHKSIEAARSAGVPVVFVRTEHNPWTDDAAWKQRLGGAIHRKRLCAGGEWGAEFYEVEPLPGEPVVTKHRYSAFVGTDLELILRSLDVGHLVIAGFAANVCVESTLRHGYMLGYRVTLLEDATAATFSHDELAATVHNVRSFFGDVSTVEAFFATEEP